MLDKELFQAVGEAILKEHSIIDRNGIYVRLGSTARYMADYSTDEIIGTHIQDYIHEEDLEKVGEQIRTLEPGKTVLLSPVRCRFKNNDYRWVESTVTNLLDNPHVNGFLVNSRDVTDAIEATHLKNKVTSSYANFFSKHPFGVVHMNMNGTIDMINPQLTLDLGYKLINIAERPLLSFFLPQYRRKVFQMFHKARLHHEPETFDVQIYKVDGSSLHINLTIVPVVYNGETIEIYGVVKDISDRTALQESLRKLSIVADKTTNGVVIADKDGKVEWVNNGFTQMNGYTLEEAVGNVVGNMLKAGASEQTKEQITKQLSMGQPYAREMLCTKKDGSTYWNLVEVTPVLDSNHKLERRISIHTDISERKKAEQELKAFADDLYKRNKELEQFAYVVSHNLRSPVANIIGLVTLLELDKEDPETVESCTKDLKTSISRLDSVIKDLSKILSMTDGSGVLAKEFINITELLKNIKLDLKKAIKQSEATIQIINEQSILYSHHAYIYSILYNLISNAIKYRSDRKPQINISITAEGESTIIQVADNGIGLDVNKHSENLFKPYKRFNTLVEGKGLGLFLVKSHIDALNGTITLDSEPGQGSTFTIVLPNLLETSN